MTANSQWLESWFAEQSKISANLTILIFTLPIYIPQSHLKIMSDFHQI